jgi:hypothetical protein
LNHTSHKGLFVSLLLALMCLEAAAAEKVLLETVPANVDRAGVLAAAREALDYRTWKVVAQDADSVTATISRNAVDAKIRIKYSGSRLLYEDSARGKGKLDYTGRVVPTVTETPERWINYLRSDITENLQKRAKESPKATPGVEEAARTEPAGKSGTAVARMQELKQMFDAGLITADEYAKKRAEILRDL